MVKICGLSTASPRLKLKQNESLKFIMKNFKMRKGTRALYKRIFKDESIATRHFSLDRLEDVMENDPDRINRRFEKQAVALSTQSLKDALRMAEIQARSLDFVAVSTCTGYICPGISAQLVESCGLRRDVRYVEVVGMGCGSAIPALEQAHNFLRANPGCVAATVSTEICSAAMYSDDSADLVISNAIFSDGSAAAVLKNSSRKGIAAVRKFSALTYPQWKETLRFTTAGGRLRNVLSKDVPDRVEESVHTLLRKLFSENGLRKSDVQYWLFHTGGKKILDLLQNSLELSDSIMVPSRHILRSYGNQSSPSVLYSLKYLLDSQKPPKKGELGLLIAYGAGFSAHCCLIGFE